MIRNQNIKKWIALPAVLAGILVLSACSNNSQTTDHQGHDMGNMTEAKPVSDQSKSMSASGDSAIEVLTGNTFTLTAKESMLHLDNNTMKGPTTERSLAPNFASNKVRQSRLS